MTDIQHCALNAKCTRETCDKVVKLRLILQTIPSFSTGGSIYVPPTLLINFYTEPSKFSFCHYLPYEVGFGSKNYATESSF